MIRRTFLTLGLAALVAPLAGFAAGGPTGFLDKTIAIDGKTHPYVVYVPRDYSPDKKWPVILFLHGAGERGTDGLKQSQVGIGLGLRMFSERYPAVVVMPQCLPNQRWADGMADMALKALDQTMADYSCDPSRQYLTGLSMGGFGSWLIASQHPKRFAAVVPICGRGSKDTASVLKDVPIWAFHGDQDNAVPVAGSRDMVEAIKAAGGTLIKYTEYPGVGHNSWDAAYSDKAMAEWLFAQKRSN
jgi:predicted peptidase